MSAVNLQWLILHYIHVIMYWFIHKDMLYFFSGDLNRI